MPCLASGICVADHTHVRRVSTLNLPSRSILLRAFERVSTRAFPQAASNRRPAWRHSVALRSRPTMPPASRCGSRRGSGSDTY